ncbi:MAG: DUF1638 domain-containing protein, partial [Clostridiales bacterium]|nr:DUF1638 domain-containing protein [Clostridiales bacterium]
YKIISCKIFYREISLITSTSEHYYDVTYIRQGLHATPEKLSETIQNEIDMVNSGSDIRTNYPPDGRPFDAILLGYALCSNCVEGLSSSGSPLVIPRAHDCISLFLGSAKAYTEKFFASSGTFWCNLSWSENCFLPDKRHQEWEYERLKARRGEKIAKKLLKAAEGWKGNYCGTAFIKWKEFEGPAQEAALKRCQECASFNGWSCETLAGDSSYMRDFLHSDWDHERFLVVPKDHKVVLTFDERLIDYE